MNQELRIKKSIKYLKKIWHFVSHHNAPIIALELAIFLGIIFAFAASTEVGDRLQVIGDRLQVTGDSEQGIIEQWSNEVVNSEQLTVNREQAEEETGPQEGNKYWANTWTEIEELEGGGFAATIHAGHRVFKDKVDGQYKKHKLTDERPEKDYVIVQSAKVCVEVHPYYAKYFDPNHEEVRLHEERWVVQRLFKDPDKWRDVDAYNPVITVEEYPEPAGDVVKVTITYDTDYGELTVEYFQRDGNNLKHNVFFKNTSGSTETFRVVQAWAGIVGDRVGHQHGEDTITSATIVDSSYFRFKKSDGSLSIFENQWSATEWLEPVEVDTHANGLKADFIFSDWVLAQDESLEIDPVTATLDDPTEDGQIDFYSITSEYTREETGPTIYLSGGTHTRHGYVEWDISSIPDGATITDTVFKYHGAANSKDSHIHEMLGARPSTGTDANVYAEVGEGTVYADPAGFPVLATNQQVDLGASADSDLQSQLSSDWFAIGIQLDDEASSGYYIQIYSEDKTDAPTPKPTLYVEYTTYIYQPRPPGISPSGGGFLIF